LEKEKKEVREKMKMVLKDLWKAIVYKADLNHVHQVINWNEKDKNGMWYKMTRENSKRKLEDLQRQEKELFGKFCLIKILPDHIPPPRCKPR
jgi:hypothetical protein